MGDPHALPKSGRRPRSVRDAAGGILALSIATFLAVTTEMLPVGLLPLIGPSSASRSRPRACS